MFLICGLIVALTLAGYVILALLRYHVSRQPQVVQLRSHESLGAAGHGLWPQRDATVRREEREHWRPPVLSQ